MLYSAQSTSPIPWKQAISWRSMVVMWKENYSSWGKECNRVICYDCYEKWPQRIIPIPLVCIIYFCVPNASNLVFFLLNPHSFGVTNREPVGPVATYLPPGMMQVVVRGFDFGYVDRPKFWSWEVCKRPLQTIHLTCYIVEPKSCKQVPLSKQSPCGQGSQNFEDIIQRL